MDYRLLSNVDDYGEDTDSEWVSGHGQQRKSNIHRYVAVFRNTQTLGGDDIEGRPEMRRGSVWQQTVQTVNTKKGFFTAVGIGVLILVLVISASVYVSHPSIQGAEKFTLFDHKNESVHLNDILTGKYSSRSFNGSWLSKDQLQYFSAAGDFVVYSATENISKVLISAQMFMTHLGKRPFQCTVSADMRYILVAYDSRKIYRHSYYALYEIFEINTGKFFPLMTRHSQDRNLQLAEWSPTENAIAFVHENDIYYRKSALDESRRITRTGNYSIYNGVTDWVYEEEMFSSFQALWFSPKSDYLAFCTFNDSEVDVIQYPLYGDPGQPFQYPMLESIPYPKSGRSNPTVTVNTVHLESLLVTPLNLPGVPPEHYISSVFWVGEKEVAVVSLNRLQNISYAHICDIPTAPPMCQEFFKLTQSNGWIDSSPYLVSKDGNRFLTITSQKQSTFSYKQIVTFDRNSVSRPVTKGEFTVDSISGWDEDNSIIYFMGTYFSEKNHSDPSQTHLYSVQEKSDHEMKCLTCDLMNTKNESCAINSVEFSKDFSHFVHTCGGPNVPESVVRNTQTLEVEKEWINNDDLRKKLEFVGLPAQKDYDIPVGNFIAKARLWLPHNFDSTKKYPLLIDVYGGPGSQKITSRFGIDWGSSLVTSKNIIYGSIDGRGSGRQSDDMMFQIYRRLGTLEVEDQIQGAKWLIENTGFIDPKRTAIWGWSYGGFATAMVMGTDFEDIYKCGISVAPVTSWNLYDTIYTERYMGLPDPQDNLVGYNDSDLVNHVENFRHKKYYLIHGNADDNVHYQQSMILSRALEKADILFRQQSYPDENHGLGGVRRHLYHSLESFLFTECFH